VGDAVAASLAAGRKYIDSHAVDDEMGLKWG